MAGWLTPGFPNWPLFTGTETLSVDTQRSGGSEPQTVGPTMQQLAVAMDLLRSNASHATVAGTRYYTSFTIGDPTNLTGLSVRVGATGGTDKFLVELHDSTGKLVATSDTGGVTAGTANIYQNIAFTAPYLAAAGTYFAVLQSNGTTATYSAYAAPTSTLLVGSATGTFGTGAAITPPTTYTQSLGPVIVPYV